MGTQADHRPPARPRTPLRPSSSPRRPPRSPLPPPRSRSTGVPAAARAAFLDWYDAHGRKLPFRATADPYAVLVSEVMAQQTQVERVGERWAAFLEAFPTVGSLASASPADVLRAWAGLGYNRRGLNLWRAARLIVERHDGVVPDEPDVLAELPGIGPYTARAVAAIAFGRPVGAVDTNVRRVLSRVAFGDRGGSAKQLQLLADEAVPADRPADWTHALMDFGAAFCRARPRCHACPVAVSCRFAAQGRDAAGPAPRDRARAARPFEETSRWLRGRILARLRDASGAAWTTFGVPIGVHDRDRVAVALATLAREGLVELHPRRSDQARLPLS